LNAYFYCSKSIKTKKHIRLTTFKQNAVRVTSWNSTRKTCAGKNSEDFLLVGKMAFRSFF